MSLPPPSQYQASQDFYQQDIQTGQAEWLHTSHQWDYQSTRRAPPSASLGRAPAYEEEHIAVVVPPAAPAVIVPPEAPALVVPPEAPALVVPPEAPALVVPPEAPTLVVPPEAPALVVPPEAPALVVPPIAPALVVPPEAPAVVVPPEATAVIVPDATAARGEPAPIIPAGEQPVDPLTSALGDQYIALQRRLTATCKRMQRDQRRFYRSQQTLLQCCIELQQDMVASLSGIGQNQSQMMRVISDMQMQTDNRWREQNQLLGVLVEHFTHQQDTASSLSSVASTPAESSESTQPRRPWRATPGTSAPSSKKPKKKKILLYFSLNLVLCYLPYNCHPHPCEGCFSTLIFLKNIIRPVWKWPKKGNIIMFMTYSCSLNHIT
ncbi:YLP motif-containing protein 1-like [Bombina bombina]|uniref:YLP motif-containing protein 1-like n=1 Tax=Bombina bombina TaxID=8345 RepID=UPI00235A8FD4|nr:YLP motif-containing protein 1-like [Bombina bombina]